MQNMPNISWASRVYNNIKRPVFSEIKLYVITIIIVYRCSAISRLKLCVAIDYCVLSFIECELTLITRTENNYQY